MHCFLALRRSIRALSTDVCNPGGSQHSIVLGRGPVTRVKETGLTVAVLVLSKVVSSTPPH
eukprot:3998193-Amphidinium_carterae.1